MKIIKASGEESLYDQEKIVRSLKRAGASDEAIREVLAKTEKELYEGMQTKDIYKHVFKNLKLVNHIAAGKYHLKKAILELGPTGFPFEKFVASLLAEEGYRTVTNQIIPGRCVNHEVDVVAESEGKHIVIECKFHSSLGTICDVKQPLYVYARFLDIARNDPQYQEGWLVTNTRFSSDAEKYGDCVGLGLMSWNYPHQGSLRDRIDRKGLYPITCLTSLTGREKEQLLANNVVLCHTLCRLPHPLKHLKLSPERKSKAMEEIRMICE